LKIVLDFFSADWKILTVLKNDFARNLLNYKKTLKNKK
jgi:hypothetical protein